MGQTFTRLDAGVNCTYYCTMAIVTYSYARQNLAKLMDEVEDDNAPVIISRQRKRGAAVLVSESEWNSIQETLYLLSSPENARRLRKGIAELNAGKWIEYDPTKSGTTKKASAKRRGASRKQPKRNRRR